MPPKKSKQQKANVSADTYFLVRDEKTARCYVLAKDQLSYVKKIGLKIGSRVTFEGPDASSVRNAGVIVMTGTKDQCETSLSLIEKTNGSNKNESTEIDSDESNELAIDDRGEDESGTESNNMKHVNNDGTAVDVTKKPLLAPANSSHLPPHQQQLHSCEHKTDITKTCREIIRFLYPNPDERAKLLISTMDIAKLKAIQDYARMVHPAQSSLPNSTLNNAMGNVFAVEKRKREQVESEDEE